MIVLYIILGVIGLLLIIALINTIVIKDRKPIQAPLEVDDSEAEKLAKEFSKMIKVKTLSYEPSKKNQAKFDELHQVMEELFPNVFKTMEKEFFEGGSILFKWKGLSDQRPMVLMAHQDVVPAKKEEWKFEPFSGEVKDGKVLGRGTLDTKSTLYAFFRACEELIVEGHVPLQDVYISSASDEEISGTGALKSVEYLKQKGVKPYIVLDEGGAIVSDSFPSVKQQLAAIGVIEKGYVNFKFTAKSKGGHSSMPPKNTPIARLAGFINECETHFPLKTKMVPEVEAIFKKAAPKMSFGYRLLFGNIWLFKPLIISLLPKISSFGRALLSTTIAFTMIEGSKTANVIPSEAYVLANLRTHPIQDINQSLEVLTKIAAKYDLTVETSDAREASPISSTSNEAYEYLVNTISKTYPDVFVAPYVMMGGTDCRFFSELTESAFRFSPVRMSSEDLGTIHGKNEAILNKTLLEAKVFYKEFVKQHK